MAAADSRGSPGGGSGLVERLRAVHAAMTDAVVTGGGLRAVAGLAAREVGSPVALVVPSHGVAVRAPEGDPEPLARYVAERLAGVPAAVPDGVTSELPIVHGGAQVGAVLVFGPPGGASPDGLALAHLAGLAAVTELALAEARGEPEPNVRSALLADLRDGAELAAEDVVRRASRAGCDLSRGAVALCADLRTERPRQALALVCDEHPGTLAELLDDRAYALLPALRVADPADATLHSARSLAQRLERHGHVGVSSFYREPAHLARAVREAELAIEVLASEHVAAETVGGGAYRLLLRVMASHPEEIVAFYEDTVAPLVRYDGQYGTQLLATVESYLAHDASMNATARALFAHRHTVAYRLDRVKELTGLDPAVSDDRERLSLGVKAYRVLEPGLPR